AVVEHEHGPVALLAKLEADERDVLPGQGPVELEHPPRLELADAPLDAVAARQLEDERAAGLELHVVRPPEPARERFRVRERPPHVRRRSRVTAREANGAMLLRHETSVTH